MIKTIEQLTEEAEWERSMVEFYTQDADDHHAEALKSEAQRVIHRLKLDALERALIVARGEST